MTEPQQIPAADAAALIREHGFDPAQLTSNERAALAALLTTDAPGSLATADASAP